MRLDVDDVLPWRLTVGKHRNKSSQLILCQVPVGNSFASLNCAAIASTTSSILLHGFTRAMRFGSTQNIRSRLSIPRQPLFPQQSPGKITKMIGIVQLLYHPRFPEIPCPSLESKAVVIPGGLENIATLL